MIEFIDIEHKYFCFDDECVCYEEDGECTCGHNEQVLRHYSRGDDIRPMTIEERQFFASKAVRDSQGYYSDAQLEVMSDKEFAQAVLNAEEIHDRSNWMRPIDD